MKKISIMLALFVMLAPLVMAQQYSAQYVINNTFASPYITVERVNAGIDGNLNISVDINSRQIYLSSLNVKNVTVHGQEIYADYGGEYGQYVMDYLSLGGTLNVHATYDSPPSIEIEDLPEIIGVSFLSNPDGYNWTKTGSTLSFVYSAPPPSPPGGSFAPRLPGAGEYPTEISYPLSIAITFVGFKSNMIDVINVIMQIVPWFLLTGVIFAMFNKTLINKI
jgi:hypothetical protein